MPTYAEWLKQRNGGGALQAAPAAPVPDDRNGIVPSPESVLGSFLGLLGPGAGALGSAIGSSYAELKDSLPKLLKIGVRGPYSSEGVGDAMLESGGRIARDVGVNAALNHAPAGIAKVLSKGGTALTAAGESAAGSAPLWKRAVTGAVVDPLLHALGVPPGVSEAAAIAGPPVARAVGKAATRVGEALPSTVMEGLVNAGKAMRPGVPETPETVPPEIQVMRDRVAGAREDASAGFAKPIAAKLNGLESEEVPYQAPEEPVNPELFPYQREALAAGREGRAANVHPWFRPAKPIEEFLRDDPAAANDILGTRTTGRFEEGSGGLTDVANGNIQPHLSPLDELAGLSTKGSINEALLRKRFRDFEVQ